MHACKLCTYVRTYQSVLVVLVVLVVLAALVVLVLPVLLLVLALLVVLVVLALLALLAVLVVLVMLALLVVLVVLVVLAALVVLVFHSDRQLIAHKLRTSFVLHPKTVQTEFTHVRTYSNEHDSLKAFNRMISKKKYVRT